MHTHTHTHTKINIHSMHTWVVVISKTNFIADCVRSVKRINFHTLTVRSTFFLKNSRIYWNVEVEWIVDKSFHCRNLLLCSIIGVLELVTDTGVTLLLLVKLRAMAVAARAVSF